MTPSEGSVVRVEPVLRAEGLLGEFNAAGVLGYADVHVALRLRELTGERDELVLLAAALAVRAVRLGSSCLDLSAAAVTTAVEGLSPEGLRALSWPEPKAWSERVEASGLVGDHGTAAPLRLVDGLLYLDRYWRQEQSVAAYVDAALRAPATTYPDDVLSAALVRLFPGGEPDRQRLAASVAAQSRFSIIAGGPGTGKTTTVARLIALLQDLQDPNDPQLRVALAAPTGKAAARLTEAVGQETAKLGTEDRARVGDLTATTIHRLLGSRPGQGARFRHHRDNRLPHDVVVVDEASMVSLTLMARLVEAVREDCRLILVGDPDQLSSVEVGAVLGDLVERRPPEGVAPVRLESASPVDVSSLGAEARGLAASGKVVLTTVHRFSEEIHAFADAIRAGEAGAVVEALSAAQGVVDLFDPGPGGVEPAGLRAEVVAAGKAVSEAAQRGDAPAALAALERHRVLCGHRDGPHGVAWWGRRVEEWLSAEIPGFAAGGPWYVGRPLIVTSNDYQLRLFNGDTGVVVADGAGVRVAFRRDGRVSTLAATRLGDVQSMHALSVHRSQGSQFDRVTLVLPPEGSPLLTRELVYTAVTRAKKHVRIIGSMDALLSAVRRPVLRASGLRGASAQLSSGEVPGSGDA